MSASLPVEPPDRLPAERSYHYRERMDKLMQLDFELVNTVLGLELNHQQNPEVIRTVIKRRCAELTKEEKRTMPQMVVEIVIALCGESMSKEFEKYLKKRPETKIEAPPKVHIKHSGTIVLIDIDGKTPDQVKNVLTSGRWWPSWCWHNSAHLTTTDTGVSLRAAIFEEFGLDDIKATLGRFGL